MPRVTFGCPTAATAPIDVAAGLTLLDVARDPRPRDRGCLRRLDGLCHLPRRGRRGLRRPPAARPRPRRRTCSTSRPSVRADLAPGLPAPPDRGTRRAHRAPCRAARSWAGDDRTGPLDGVPPGGRVVVAMSGGVDSSVAAALLAEAGYEVVGVTLQLYDHGAASGRKGACCAGPDIHDARAVADRLGIAHYVLDFEARFRAAVIDDFADTYAAGPHADPLRALQRADQVPRPSGDRPRPRCRRPGHRPLCPPRRRAGRRRAAPRGRPGQGPELLPVRDHGRAAGLPALPPGRPGQGRDPRPRPAPGPGGRRQARQPGHLLRAQRPLQRRGRNAAPGRVRSPARSSMSTAASWAATTASPGSPSASAAASHVADGERLYVVGIEPDRAPRRGRPARMPATAPGPAPDPRQLAGRAQRPTCRSPSSTATTSRPPPARIELLADGRAAVTLDEPQSGVAPGQACVAYAGTRLLGGGWIERATAAWQATADRLSA